jgi:hypothetical protein
VAELKNFQMEQIITPPGYKSMDKNELGGETILKVSRNRMGGISLRRYIFEDGLWLHDSYK